MRNKQLEKPRWNYCFFARQFAVSAYAEDLPTQVCRDSRNLSECARSGKSNIAVDRWLCFGFYDRLSNIGWTWFDHMKVALLIGLQIMVRSIKPCAGCLFTLDPDNWILIRSRLSFQGAFGTGEKMCTGSVNTDEFLVY